MFWQMELVDEFHVAMYELEKRFHGGVNLELNVCLKHDLGNKMVDELRWSTEPPGKKKLNNSHSLSAQQDTGGLHLVMALEQGSERSR